LLKGGKLSFLGAPYPIDYHPKGFFHTQDGVDQIKSDLLMLLLTNPNERVMLPNYGTPLNTLLFEQGDSSTIEQATEMIANSIKMWEPRVAITDIQVTMEPNEVKKSLDTNDLQQDTDHILLIKIKFSDYNDINQINELVLYYPGE
jgi:uncharacterized protein